MKGFYIWKLKKALIQISTKKVMKILNHEFRSLMVFSERFFY